MVEVAAVVVEVTVEVRVTRVDGTTTVVVVVGADAAGAVVVEEDEVTEVGTWAAAVVVLDVWAAVVVDV